MKPACLGTSGSKAGLCSESPPPLLALPATMDLCSVHPDKKGPNMRLYSFFFNFSCTSSCMSFILCLPQANCSAASQGGTEGQLVLTMPGYPLPTSPGPGEGG